ncbi:MAG: hypothetical protein QNJ15_14200 [Erythrobacter sp.]|nr:hypothetical protein [Erythrobacter sp.]
MPHASAKAPGGIAAFGSLTLVAAPASAQPDPPDFQLRRLDGTAGGARANAFFANGWLGPGVADLLRQLRKKFDYIERRGLRTGTVTFSNIVLPGDPPNKGDAD